MHRSVSLRVAAFVLVATLSTPVFAAPSRDDSPLAGFERAVSRLVQQIKKVFDLPVLQLPPG